jgi:hypothetical protein
VIELRSPYLAVRLDEAHGAEILDLVDLRTGRQLLGRPPFRPGPPRGGDLDEAEWTAAYRGGWQVLLPNAGTACEVDGTTHGFHGRASNDPWEVDNRSSRSAVLTWSGHGLRATRRVEIADDGLFVGVEVTALAERVPLLLTEHIALGLELVDPELGLELPGGRAFELDEETGPPEPPPDAAAWPELRLLDGSAERADRWPLSRERSRLFCVSALPAGRAIVRNLGRPQALDLSWSVGVLPHLWVWHEVRTYGGPWARRAELLVVEPSSVPHTLGLATAIAHGQARWLDRNESVSYELVARPTPGSEDGQP